MIAKLMLCLCSTDNVVEPKVTANLASVSTSTVIPNADAGQKVYGHTIYCAQFRDCDIQC